MPKRPCPHCGLEFSRLQQHIDWKHAGKAEAMQSAAQRVIAEHKASRDQRRRAPEHAPARRVVDDDVDDDPPPRRSERRAPPNERRRQTVDEELDDFFENG